MMDRGALALAVEGWVGNPLRARHFDTARHTERREMTRRGHTVVGEVRLLASDICSQPGRLEHEPSAPEADQALPDPRRRSRRCRAGS